MVAAETAYREQVALNQSLSTKFDELGSKIDALTSVMTQLVTKIDALAPSPSRVTKNTTPSPPSKIDALAPSTPHPTENITPSPSIPIDARHAQLPSFQSSDAHNYENSRSPSRPTAEPKLEQPEIVKPGPALRPLQLPKIVSDSTMDDIPKRDRKSITAQRLSIFGPPRYLIMCPEPVTLKVVPLSSERETIHVFPESIQKQSDDEGYFSDSEHVPNLAAGKASVKFSSRKTPVLSSIPCRFLPRAKNLQCRNFKSRRKRSRQFVNNDQISNRWEADNDPGPLSPLLMPFD